MRFVEDLEQPGWFYIDREIDDRADHFAPCRPCAAELGALGRSGEIWFKGQLCGECYTALEVLGEIAEAADERLQIMDPVRDPWVLGDDGSWHRPDDPMLQIPPPGGPPPPTTFPFFDRIP